MRNARENMIENQIRAGGVSSQRVFDSLDAIRRTDFVPPAYREYAYADMEIPLPCSQHMLTPLTEARILEAVSVNENETVLEIGTGSGYMAALLAHGARHVTSVEIEPVLKEMAENNLSHCNARNVHILCENGFAIERYAPNRLFDVIVLSGTVSSIPDIFTNHLADNGRMVYFHGTGFRTCAFLLKKTPEAGPDIRSLFDTSAKALREQAYHSRFRF